jgi:hypothetical protein
LAPRAGFAWTANEAAQLIVRGGYGIYYNLGALATSEGLFFNPPFFNLNVFFPFTGLPPLTLANPFPANFPIPLPQSATSFQRDLKTPWMEHWNLGVQRGFGRSMAAEIAYVGSRGHDLISARDINQPSASPGFNPPPDPRFADITLIESRATSRYNGLQFRFHKRSEESYSALLSYTLGKCTDDASGFFTSAGDPNFPQNSLDPEAERGRSAFDVRHRFSLAFSYPLPLGPERRWVTGGIMAKILSEMEVRGVYTRNSGRPFTVALLPTIEASNTGRSNLGFGYNDRPNVSGDPSLSSRSEEAWFDTSAFTFPAFGSFGDSGRNTLEGPGYRNLNLSIVKNVWFGLTRRLELRLESFNLFNSVNFDLPDAFLGSPTFGRILSAQSPRRWQLAAKYLF